MYRKKPLVFADITDLFCAGNACIHEMRISYSLGHLALEHFVVFSDKLTAGIYSLYQTTNYFWL